MKDTILVIGSSGQIGTELVMKLREMYGNHHVEMSDVRPSSEVMQSGPFEELDIMNEARLHKIVKNTMARTVSFSCPVFCHCRKNIELGWSLNMRSLSHVLDLGREKADKKSTGQALLQYLGLLLHSL